MCALLGGPLTSSAFDTQETALCSFAIVILGAGGSEKKAKQTILLCCGILSDSIPLL
jgi:hypothetical protein